MFLTIYYVAATFLQSWRIRNIYNKINSKLSEKCSVVFYNLSKEGNGELNITSELCMNNDKARISDILWLKNNQRGCSIVPLQIIHLGPWVTFSESQNLIPFELYNNYYRYKNTDGNNDDNNATVEIRNDVKNNIFDYDYDNVDNTNIYHNNDNGGNNELNFDSNKLIYLLLETDTVPIPESETNDIVMIEKYGKPLAWKVDSHFAVILESDIDHFTKLIMSTFMQDNFTINDRLPLIRIESVNCEGKPQPFDLLKNHLRKQLISRAMRHLSANEWEKHLSGLRSLSILANQAIEFEYNKNRTEGKTGVVKPDLIPSSSSSTTTTTATRSIEEKTNRKLPSSSKLSPKQSPSKSTAIEIVNELATKTSNLSLSPNKKLQELQNSAEQLAATATETVKTTAVTVAAAAATESKEIIDRTSSPSTSGDTRKTSTSKSSTTIIDSDNLVDDRKLLSETTPEITLPPSTTATTTDENQKTPSKSIPIENLDSVTATSVKSSDAELKITDVKPDEYDYNAPIVPRPIPKASEVASISSSSDRNNTKRPSLVRNKGSLLACKPPNVLVYSDSITIRDSVIATLKNILEKDMYTIYPLSTQQVQQKIWIDNTSLLIVCGSVEPKNSEILVDYFLHGGKMLSLCSDLLHIIVPTYRTAEVREHELVQFSYDKWQKVKMMHHIFCYQPSPVKKHFSTEGEESIPALTKKPALVCPRSVEVKDLQGDMHNLDVKVLGTEETWNTPSLLLANNIKSGGKAVFSQVHLEADPTQYETDEIKFSVLKQNDKARLEIFSDLLKTHLDIIVQKSDDQKKMKNLYKNAYFLGHHELKFELIEKLRSNMESENFIRLNDLCIKFCGKGEQPPAVNKNFLPILILSCPEDFSTVNYFDNLKTKSIGRLVIYVPVISSSMHIVNELTLTHGIAVIPRQQTEATGRNNNQWLSPEGCVMFSLQLHISLNSIFGQKLSLLQHFIAVSITKAILGIPECENLDIRIKWPNDIYANGITKIGGLIINSKILDKNAICNIGCAINLNNSNPTTCINDLIKDYNRSNNKNIKLLEYEKLLAIIFTEIEKLYDRIQCGDLALLYELYYRYWLHTEQEVIIYDKNGQKKSSKIIGIDDYGYLEVQNLQNGKIEIVHPDGNSFDMLRGLIIPK